MLLISQWISKSEHGPSPPRRHCASMYPDTAAKYAAWVDESRSAQRHVTAKRSGHKPYLNVTLENLQLGTWWEHILLASGEEARMWESVLHAMPSIPQKRTRQRLSVLSFPGCHGSRWDDNNKRAAIVLPQRRRPLQRASILSSASCVLHICLGPYTVFPLLRASLEEKERDREGGKIDRR